MELQSIIISIVTLLIIIIVGYSARRWNILTKDSLNNISKFVLFIALPSLILVSSSSQTFDCNSLDIVKYILISTIIYYVISIIVSLIITHFIHSKPNEIGIYRFVLVFPSAVFFAFPLIDLIFGKTGVFYAAIFNLPYFVLAFSLGIWLIISPLKNHSHPIKFDLHVLLNMAFISTLIGLLLYFTSIQIPDPLSRVISLLGEMATPLALIVAGGFLYEVSMRSLFKNINHYIIAISRLIILPLIVYIIIKQVLPLEMSGSNIILAIAVIIASMPAAVQTVIIATEYKANPETAAEIIFITTILAVATLPLILFITGVV